MPTPITSIWGRPTATIVPDDGHQGRAVPSRALADAADPLLIAYGHLAHPTFWLRILEFHVRANPERELGELSLPRFVGKHHKVTRLGPVGPLGDCARNGRDRGGVPPLVHVHRRRPLGEGEPYGGLGVGFAQYPGIGFSVTQVARVTWVTRWMPRSAAPTAPGWVLQAVRRGRRFARYSLGMPGPGRTPTSAVSTAPQLAHRTSCRTDPPQAEWT